MNEIRNHRDLEAWRLAMDVVMETYELTECFPAKEIYGLQSQMRRAAVSVPSNIAEGQARPLRASLNHLSIALGSLAELDTQLEIAIRRQPSRKRRRHASARCITQRENSSSDSAARSAAASRATWSDVRVWCCWRSIRCRIFLRELSGRAKRNGLYRDRSFSRYPSEKADFNLRAKRLKRDGSPPGVSGFLCVGLVN